MKCARQNRVASAFTFFFPGEHRGNAPVCARVYTHAKPYSEEKEKEKKSVKEESVVKQKKKSQELGGSKYTTFYFVTVCKYACMASRSKNQLKRRERCVSNENTCFPFFLVVDVVVETCFLCHAEGKQENKKKGKRGSALEVHAHYS